MPDLAQQIRERLDALAAPPLPAAFIEVSGVPDEDLEAWQRVFDEVAEKALPLRILPASPKWTPPPGPRNAALLAVVELHAPETEHSWELYRARWMPERAPSGPLCSQCSAGYEHQVPYPCRTVRTIAEQLGIEVDRG